MRIAVLALLAAACTRSPGLHLDAAAPPRDATASDAAMPPITSWRQRTIYLVMTDRFRDGNPANNTAGNPSCFTPAQPKGFHGGDFAGLRANLDYLATLGASAVWITPVNVQTDCGFHGYYIDMVDPSDDAIEPKLGTSDELAGLADDLHARGMQLVLDMVVNHTGDHARLPGQHPDWFHDPATCTSLGPADVYCPVGGHPDLAQEQPEVAAYLSGLWSRVIARYHVDGIRMDTAKHVPASYFATSFFPAVRAVRPDLFAVAEIWDGAQAFPPYLDAGFTSAFHFPLYYALDSALAKGGSANAIADAVAQGIAAVGADRAKDLVLFVNNHDTPRFASEPGTAVPAAEIERRLILALDLIFTLPGIPQLYYGDELAMYGGPDPDNRRMLPAWATDPAQRAQPHPGDAAGDPSQVFARVQRLARLRAGEPALADGDYRELWRPNGGQEVFAFSRGTGTDQRIIAICNQATPCSVEVKVHGLPDGTQLVDELGDGAAAATIANGALPLQLAPRSAAIYRPAP